MEILAPLAPNVSPWCAAGCRVPAQKLFILISSWLSLRFEKTEAGMINDRVDRGGLIKDKIRGVCKSHHWSGLLVALP